jgi:predicted glycosyltransferase
MRIWFDISNSPHVNMFQYLIEELKTEGHEVLITSRPLANTVDLLNQKKIKHTIIGAHYGKNLVKKFLGFPIRVYQLYQFLKDKNVDVAVAQSSFHSPITAKLLGIPSIYTNDNEHAFGNWPSFVFATRILLPEQMKVPNWHYWGVSRQKFIMYPGVKEGIYLWTKVESIYRERKTIVHSKPLVYIRPEPNTAQYYNGKQFFLDETILALKEHVTITILTRNEAQRHHYMDKKFDGIYVPLHPIDFDYIACNCSLFIGAGGSMTRELALLAVPTISVYQDTLLKVDQLLIEKGLMWHDPVLSASRVMECLRVSKHNEPNLEMMEKGKQAYNMLKEEILSFESVEKFFYY